MTVFLQEIVDRFAEHIGRPVTLNDSQLRLIAYSAHDGPVDPVRLTSILKRDGPDDIKRWIVEQGIAERETPLRIPANDALGLAERVCVPIRYAGKHLGNFWILEGASPLTTREMEAARDAARSCALEMHDHQRKDSGLAPVQGHKLVDKILHGGKSTREEARDELLRRNTFSEDDRPVAVIVEFVESSERPGAVANLERPRKQMSAVFEDYEAISNYALNRIDYVLRNSPSQELIADLRRNILELRSDSSSRAIVGIGGEAASLDSLAGSYWQAGCALRVARSDRDYDGVTSWCDMGLYRAIIERPDEELWRLVADFGVDQLLEESRQDLRLTLERYLDMAGHAKAAAEEVHIHRATLYSRLQRTEELIGVDLGDGAIRSRLHLALKAARLVPTMPQTWE